MEQSREFEVDGERIAATIHIPEETPAPGIVMCHGFTGQRMEAHFLFKAARSRELEKSVTAATWGFLRGRL